MKEVPISLLDELFIYDPVDGRLTWKERPREHFATERVWRTWNTRFAGKEAGSVGPNGYREVGIYSSLFKAHRVIWAMVNRYWPDEVDHENGIKDDNRLDNLRDVSHSGNCRNRGFASNNPSGRVGVYKQRYGWKVLIGREYIGSFDNFEDAVQCREQAEQEHGYHKNHGKVRS